MHCSGALDYGSHSKHRGSENMADIRIKWYCQLTVSIFGYERNGEVHSKLLRHRFSGTVKPPIFLFYNNTWLEFDFFCCLTSQTVGKPFISNSCEPRWEPPTELCVCVRVCVYVLRDKTDLDGVKLYSHARNIPYKHVTYLANLKRKSCNKTSKFLTMWKCIMKW